MKITYGEQLIVGMLNDLYSNLKVKGDVDPDFISEAMSGGHHWAIKSKYPQFFSDSVDNEETLEETYKILDMWSILESAYNRFSPAEKALVAREDGTIWKDVKFEGFDGNNESEHLGIADMLINKLGRYEIFQGRGLNSHSMSIDIHRRMLEVYKTVLNEERMGQFTPEEVAKVMNGRIHPDYK